jgi:hypothetical protein
MASCKGRGVCASCNGRHMAQTAARLTDLEPPPISSARGPPTDWGELIEVHDDRAVFQSLSDELPVIDIHNLRPQPGARYQRSRQAARLGETLRRRRKTPFQGVSPAFLKRLFGARHIGHSAHKPLIRSGNVAEVPLAGLYLSFCQDWLRMYH